MFGLNWPHVLREDQMNISEQSFEKMFSSERKSGRQQHSWRWSYEGLRTWGSAVLV